MNIKWNEWKWNLQVEKIEGRWYTRNFKYIENSFVSTYYYYKETLSRNFFKQRF